MTTIAGQKLLSYIERIENLEGEMKELRAAKKSVFDEAKDAGFNTKVVKKIIAVRKQDQASRKIEEEELALYLVALGIE